MSRRAVTTVVGLGGAAGLYYLYNAGGDTTVAKKDAEKDIARLTNNKSGEAQKQAESWANQAGAKAEHASQDAKSKLNQTASQASAQFDKTKQDVSQKFAEIRADTDKKIDKFDATVEKKASEAKSGLSSWWGSK